MPKSGSRWRTVVNKRRGKKKKKKMLLYKLAQPRVVTTAGSWPILVIEDRNKNTSSREFSYGTAP